MSGVGAARVIRVWDGAGTVKVILADNDMQPAAAETVSATTAYIEGLRPVGAEVAVVAATRVTVNVSATVTLSSGAESGRGSRGVQGGAEGLSVRDGAGRLRRRDRRGQRYAQRLGADGEAEPDPSRCCSMFAGVVDITGAKLNGSAANLTLTVSRRAGAWGGDT